MSHDPEMLSLDEVTEFTSLHEYDCFLRTHNGACDCQLGPIVKLLITERRTVRTLEARLKQCEGSRRVHELDNHHNALACGYCSGPIKDESERLQAENKKLRAKTSGYQWTGRADVAPVLYDDSEPILSGLSRLAENGDATDSQRRLASAALTEILRLRTASADVATREALDDADIERILIRVLGECPAAARLRAGEQSRGTSDVRAIIIAALSAARSVVAGPTEAVDLPTFDTTKEAMLYAQRSNIPTVIPAAAPTPSTVDEAAHRAAIEITQNVSWVSKHSAITTSDVRISARRAACDLVTKITRAEFGNAALAATIEPRWEVGEKALDNIAAIISGHVIVGPREDADQLVDEVQHRMDQVVEAAVEWHQAGREGAEWFGKAEALSSAIDSLLKLRLQREEL